MVSILKTIEIKTIIVIIITIIWFLFMTTLSHIPGEPSGAESRWLSRITGVKEDLLRKAAHVVCFAVLGCLGCVALSVVSDAAVVTEASASLASPVSPAFTASLNTWLWFWVGALVIWSIVDEARKALPIFPGRHCSLSEIGLNLIGSAIGIVIGLFMCTK